MGGKLFIYGIVLFALGIILLGYLLRRIYNRIRYRDTGDPKSRPPRGLNIYIVTAAVLLIVIAQVFFWVSSQVRFFRPFGAGGMFGSLVITRTGDPVKSLEMRFTPSFGDSAGVENRFYLSGDSWRMRGEMLQFKFLNHFLELPDSCYKLVEFNSDFLGRLPKDAHGALLSRETIEGGESGAYRFFHDTKLFKWFAEADSFSTDWQRVEGNVGIYLYIRPDGTVELR
jgi:hypothetical protein